MRILHVFNVANDAYNIASAQRKIGIDAHLLLDETHSVFNLPNWENIRRRITNVYTTMKEDEEMWELPYWIQTIKGNTLARTIDMFKKMQGYDLIQSYPPSAIYLQMQRTPYIIYECGWLRKLTLISNNQANLGRRGYMSARHMIMTNPDLYTVVDMVDYLPDDTFIPFAIPTENYPYMEQPNNEQMIYFCPSRQNSMIKGTDRMITAFAKYLKVTDLKPKPILYMVSMGGEVEKMKAMVQDLPTWMHKHFQWLDVMSKPELVMAYHTADVVLDQLLVGSYGTAAPEAMSCGRPVMMYLHREYNRRAYGAVPPIVNVFRINEIVDAMVEMENPDEREKYGTAGRKWVEKHHDPIKVAREHKELYERMLG